MKIKEIIKKAKSGKVQLLREKDFFLKGEDYLENRQIFQEVVKITKQGKIFLLLGK